MDALSKLAGKFSPAQLKALKAFKNTHGVEKLKDMVAEAKWAANVGEGAGKLGKGRLGLAAWAKKKPLTKHSSVESFNGDFRMNALEKYAAKSKLIKKLMKKMKKAKKGLKKGVKKGGEKLYGKKPVRGSRAELIGTAVGGTVGHLARKKGVGPGALSGAGAGGAIGSVLDTLKHSRKKRLWIARQKKVSLGIGAAAGGAAGASGASGLAAIIAKKKKSKKKG
tara:strand:+ start:678 stop:1346 length:669 start_codon:yes stop_codon:yes gene_type:complete